MNTNLKIFLLYFYGSMCLLAAGKLVIKTVFSFIQCQRYVNALYEMDTETTQYYIERIKDSKNDI